MDWVTACSFVILELPDTTGACVQIAKQSKWEKNWFWKETELPGLVSIGSSRSGRSNCVRMCLYVVDVRETSQEVN